MKASGYGNRLEQVAGIARNKKVLDLGIVGETCADTQKRVGAFPSSLHMRLQEAASELVGVDSATAEIKAITAEYGTKAFAADVEAMSKVVGPVGPFDVVVAGDIIEHLSNPGLALDEIRKVINPRGTLVVTCPNAFGAPNFLRFLLGLYREGEDHVASHSKYTLENLLARHGFEATEVLTAYNRPPTSRRKRLLFHLGSMILRRVPELGGTLVVKAQPTMGEATPA